MHRQDIDAFSSLRPLTSVSPPSLPSKNAHHLKVPSAASETTSISLFPSLTEDIAIDRPFSVSIAMSRADSSSSSRVKV
jgi:hypothetical protein